MTEEYKSQTAPVKLTVHPLQKIDIHHENRKNVGCCIPLTFYHALDIEVALNNKQARSEIKFNLNAVMRLLINERLLYPGSKKSAYDNKDRYFYKSESSCDDLYRALDIFAQAKDSLIAAVNKNIARICSRDTSNVFFDVTNYHFECEEDDSKKRGVSKQHQPKPLIQMGLIQAANAIPLAYKLFLRQHARLTNYD